MVGQPAIPPNPQMMYQQPQVIAHSETSLSSPEVSKLLADVAVICGIAAHLTLHVAID